MSNKSDCITQNIIHPICSFLIGVIFFGAGAVGILIGVVVEVCEELSSPSKKARRLHKCV